MKINNNELFLIIILIIKSKNDSDTNNISTIFSTNPTHYSTNEIHSYINISSISTSIISTFNNNKNIFQSIPMNSTFINVNQKILGKNSNFTNIIIETTVPKIKSTFPTNNNTLTSQLNKNNFIDPAVYIQSNYNSLFFLQVQAMDYLLKIYLFNEKNKYPNSLKTKIYVDIPSENQIIIRERLFVIANYSRNKNNIIEYTSTLPDYLNTPNFSVTIEKIDIIEDKNDNQNIYDIYFGVNEDNLNTLKAENLIDNGFFNFSNIFNMTNYSYYIYDVQNISQGCSFSINLSENSTIYNRKKTIEINFTQYNKASTINAICTFSSEYTNQISCSTENNITNSNYTFNPFVYPFEDEIFIFRQKKDQVFHLFCYQKNESDYKTSKLIIIATVLAAAISIGFLVILVVACFKHRDNLSPVSNKSVIVSSNTINKEAIVDSSMALNK